MGKKFFTADEANALLPVIQADLTMLQQIKHQFEQKYTELQHIKAGTRDGQKEAAADVFMLESSIEFLQLEAKMHIRNIHQQGAQLKEIDAGLIDFPAIVDGEEVLLCWRQGEKQITHYHGVNDGFIGRKPLDEER